MAEPPFDLPRAQRWFAIEFNNRAWELLERPGLDDEEAAELLDAAHAARRHWLAAGGPVNRIRAECLLANAYARLGAGTIARGHAERGLVLCTDHAAAAADWDLAFAWDALARAEAAAGRSAAAERARELARTAGDAIADPQDRAAFAAWSARPLPGPGQS